jgi:lysozyme
MRITESLIKIVEEEEGWSAVPYLCPAKKWTIGFGSTFWEDGTPVKKDDKPIDKERGRMLVKAHFAREVEPALDSLVKVSLTQNQYDALADFVYNVGVGNFASSTLLKKLNAKDYAGAANEFPKWNKGGGKVLNGLVRRRKKEQDLFLKT